METKPLVRWRRSLLPARRTRAARDARYAAGPVVLEEPAPDGSPILAARLWLAAPVDAASSAAFRVLLGALLLISAARFFWNGWIDEFYATPRYHFGWPLFEWLTPFPRALLYVHFALLGVAALGFMLGLYYRFSALALLFAFTCVELFDKTYYLNHYYLVSLLLALAVVLPLGGCASLDARRDPARASATVPRYVPLLLAAQLGLVYFFAGLGKVDDDWLLRAQPLATWLGRYADVPVLGPLLQLPAVAYGMAWCSALFDLSVAFLLAAPRTRAAAYALVIVFHVLTGLLFPIGVFPWLMIALTPIFFAPDWPRRLLARLRVRVPSPRASAAPLRPLQPRIGWALALYLAVQLALPLRHLLYPGHVNWTEDGFRFAWRVMLIEKTGHVELRVRDPKTGRTFTVSPRDELNPRQVAMMATQPDMILQYAQHVAERFAAQGHPGVEVYADAFAALNGRKPQRFIDPTWNLAEPVSLLEASDFVLPLAE